MGKVPVSARGQFSMAAAGGRRQELRAERFGGPPAGSGAPPGGGPQRRHLRADAVDVEHVPAVRVGRRRRRRPFRAAQTHRSLVEQAPQQQSA